MALQDRVTEVLESIREAVTRKRKEWKSSKQDEDDEVAEWFVCGFMINGQLVFDTSKTTDAEFGAGLKPAEIAKAKAELAIGIAKKIAETGTADFKLWGSTGWCEQGVNKLPENAFIPPDSARTIELDPPSLAEAEE